MVNLTDSNLNHVVNQRYWIGIVELNRNRSMDVSAGFISNEFFDMLFTY